MSLWWSALLFVAVLLLAAYAFGGRLLRRAVRRIRDDDSRRPVLWNHFYGLGGWRETATNNYGFAPADGDHPERFQHQMYRELLRRLARVRPLDRRMRLLEVSCGRGGGLVAFLDSAPAGTFEAVGLDVARNAVEYCRSAHRRDGLSFIEGSALDLPFAEGSFDVVLNVEASNAYGDRRRFFEEVARVLKPDGVFVYADSCRPGEQCAQMAEQLAAAGFVAELEDITANVFEACRADSGRRRELIDRRVPYVLRRIFGRRLANYAAVEGSKKFAAFGSGRRLYKMAAATKS